MSAEKNKDIVRSFIHALVQEDVEVMKPLVYEDIIWWLPPSAEALGLARPMKGWSHIPWLGGGGWPAFAPGTSTIDILHVIAEGDLVAIHYTRNATRRNGNHFFNAYNFLFRLEDGKIVEAWEHADTSQAASSR